MNCLRNRLLIVCFRYEWFDLIRCSFLDNWGWCPRTGWYFSELEVSRSCFGPFAGLPAFGNQRRSRDCRWIHFDKRKLLRSWWTCYSLHKWMKFRNESVARTPAPLFYFPCFAAHKKGPNLCFLRTSNWFLELIDILSNCSYFQGSFQIW